MSATSSSGGRASSKAADQVRHVAGIEGIDRDDVGDAVAPQRPHELVGERRLAWPHRCDDAHAPDRRLHEVAHRSETRGVGRVHVVQYDDGAPTRLSDAGDEPGDAFEREQVELRSIELEGLLGHRPFGKDQSQTSVERCHRLRGGVAAQPRPQRFAEDAERRGGDDRSSAGEHGDAGLPSEGRHLAEEARLADAALAHQHHTGGFTGASTPDRPAEHVELVVAPDDHRGPHCPHRRHATSLVLLGLVLPRMSAGRRGCIIGPCPSKK